MMKIEELIFEKFPVSLQRERREGAGSRSMFCQFHVLCESLGVQAPGSERNLSGLPLPIFNLPLH
jgi:hypothetical protein